jgi:acetylornithine deacetylase/succinyl-diaminopimelate desuccinylase-like protein
MSVRAMWQAMESVNLVYKGRNSHAGASIGSRLLADFLTPVARHSQPLLAAGAPWEGVNALNAVIQAFNNVDAMRQQMKPSWRVHGIITEGGLKPNIIPDRLVLILRHRCAVCVILP